MQSEAGTREAPKHGNRAFWTCPKDIAIVQGWAFHEEYGTPGLQHSDLRRTRGNNTHAGPQKARGTCDHYLRTSIGCLDPYPCRQRSLERSSSP